MKRLALAIILLLGGIYAAAAQFNGCPPGLCGSSGGFGNSGGGFGPGGSAAAPAATGKILMVDGASFILQTDAASKICRAGGC